MIYKSIFWGILIMNKFDYTFTALWTNCSISIIKENDNWLNKIINTCYNRITCFENEFSRFKSDSDLSILNLKKKLEVSDEFLSLINKSRIIYALTNGYFNPLIDVRKIWYSSSFEKNNFEIIDVNENLDFSNVKNYWNLLEIDNFMNIDFWSIAKWFIADIISDYLKSQKILNFIVNMWWDIVGSGLNLELKPWKIAITNPENIDDILYLVELKNKSISTSWIYKRNWQINGQNYHHIRNPFSLHQETKLKSVTIVDVYWYKTDALATAVIAMWYEKWLEFCKTNNISFLFILDDLSIVKSDDL